MTVGSLAPGAHTFQWRRAGAPLSNGPTGTGSTISGATTSTLAVTGVSISDMASYDCLVGDLCGSVASNGATLNVCAADFNCDGFLDFFDYSDFVQCFETEVCSGGSSDFNADGFVDFFDYADFVLAFETGC